MKQFLSQISLDMLHIFCYDHALPLWDKAQSSAQLMESLSQPPYRAKLLAWAQRHYSQLYHAYLQRQETMNLPDKTYQTFVGRTHELAILKEFLTTAKPVMAVIGMGGMGKTSLVHELLLRGQQAQWFAHAMWHSAKVEFLEDEKVVQRGAANYDLPQVVDDLARQLGRAAELGSLPLEQKLVAMGQILASGRYLIVLDNLETVSQRDEIVNSLVPLLGATSKIILTSRVEVSLRQPPAMLRLTGFTPSESEAFLRSDGQDVEAIAKASPKQLKQIHDLTGGAPLAMRLVVGQCRDLPFDTVLTDFQEAKAKGRDADFYRFIFQHIWLKLDEPSRVLLVYLSRLPALKGGAAAQIREMTAKQRLLRDDALWTAMRQLVRQSLVDKQGAAGKERYALHPLTMNFIKSDITKELKK